MSTDVHAQRKQVAEQIAAVEQSLHFLHSLHPTNAQEQQEQFLSGKIDEPQFLYREMDVPEVDFSFFKDDSPIGNLYRERINFTEAHISLIRLRGDDEAFARKSQEIFPVTALKNPDIPPVQEGEEEVGIEEIVSAFEKTLKDNNLSSWKVVVTANLSSRIMVEQQEATIFLAEGLTLSKPELEAIIRHEIGVHVLRFENGKRQQEPLLSVGTARGRLIEEGVAMFVENPQGDRRIFLRHHIVQFAQQHSFRETWEEAQSLGLSEEKAWSTVLRVKRGMRDGASHGAFTKDVLYAQGFEEIQKYRSDGGDLKSLLSAPIHPSEISVFQQEGGFEVFNLPQFLKLS